MQNEYLRPDITAALSAMQAAKHLTIRECEQLAQLQQLLRAVVLMADMTERALAQLGSQAVPEPTMETTEATALMLALPTIYGDLFP
jgi:conjugal transfer/entry exclusion protein